MITKFEYHLEDISYTKTDSPPPCSVGDYVLATKYNDGDPQDHWAIGFFDGITEPHYNPPRYDVIDNGGNQFRGNGFRRVEKISAERGAWMLARVREIELSGRSVWHFARCRMSEQNAQGDDGTDTTGIDPYTFPVATQFS